jgi:hypothetical protein
LLAPAAWDCQDRSEEFGCGEDVMVTSALPRPRHPCRGDQSSEAFRRLVWAGGGTCSASRFAACCLASRRSDCREAPRRIPQNRGRPVWGLVRDVLGSPGAREPLEGGAKSQSPPRQRVRANQDSERKSARDLCGAAFRVQSWGAFSSHGPMVAPWSARSRAAPGEIEIPSAWAVASPVPCADRARSGANASVVLGDKAAVSPRLDRS